MKIFTDIISSKFGLILNFPSLAPNSIRFHRTTCQIFKSKYADAQACICVQHDLQNRSLLLLVAEDEMFSDTYKMKLVDEVMYEVTGKVNFS